MSGTGLVAASNRRRVIIIASAVLVFLIFVSFRPSAPQWPSRQGGEKQQEQQQQQRPPTTDGRPKVPPQDMQQNVPVNSEYDDYEAVKASATHTAAAAAKSSAHAAVADKPVATSVPGITSDEVCKTHAKMTDMLVVMKTGATEAYDKLPIHFLTTLRCANDTILFSDMEMEMGGHHIIDALDEVKPAIKKGNPDFNLYELLQEYRVLHEDPRSLKNGGNGWNLDKYKFTHMMAKTWRYRQDAPWYVFIEADTYVSWDNMRTLLDKFNPDEPLYIGSPTYLDIEFAHGGTGYIISRAAMKKAVGGHMDITDKYDKEVRPVCCGDRFPARILLDEEIKLTKVWPMFNGEKPLTLPYGANHWCQPIITMHHVTSQEVSQIWTYEQYRKKNGIKGPMLIKDMYEHFVKENLHGLNPPVRQDWDNLSVDRFYKPHKEKNNGLNEGKDFLELSDVKRKSVESPQNCEKLCSSESNCYGWTHKDNECKLSHSIKIGGHMKPDNGKHFVSGWNMKTINEFIAKMQDCPNGPDWHIRGI